MEVAKEMRRADGRGGERMGGEGKGRQGGEDRWRGVDGTGGGEEGRGGQRKGGEERGDWRGGEGELIELQLALCRGSTDF